MKEIDIELKVMPDGRIGVDAPDDHIPVGITFKEGILYLTITKIYDTTDDEFTESDYNYLDPEEGVDRRPLTDIFKY